MSLAELKPILATLALPPAGPLLLIGLGLLLAWPGARTARAGRRRLGVGLGLAGAALLWLLSCHAVAVWLSRHALPQVAPLSPAQVSQLRQSGVQAVVVLGGGVQARAPEYGAAQPSGHTAARVRYGVHVARGSGLPLAFAGGVGWAASGVQGHPSEAGAAERHARELGASFRWLDDRSRDTHENAWRLRELMQPQGVRRIALVTHAWHLPRSIRHFEAAGFEVVPAPMGYLEPQERPLLEWLPSGGGLADSRRILREWLGLRLS